MSPNENDDAAAKMSRPEMGIKKNVDTRRGLRRRLRSRDNVYEPYWNMPVALKGGNGGNAASNGCARVRTAPNAESARSEQKKRS